MEDSSRPLSILIVDDHTAFRESVALALAAQPGFSVSHCGSTAEALRMVAQRPIDIVLLDYDLGQERGSAFLPGAKRSGFAGRVLVVTAFVSDYEAQRLVREGVAGIFFKHSSIAELVEAIRAVASGGAWLEQRLLHLITSPESAKEAGAGPKALSARERGVLGLLFEGLGNKEIAARLQISEHSVKAVLQGLFAKTGARTRGQLVRVALESYQEPI